MESRCPTRSDEPVRAAIFGWWGARFSTALGPAAIRARGHWGRRAAPVLNGAPRLQPPSGAGRRRFVAT
jgi:hypothetical protein